MGFNISGLAINKNYEYDFEKLQRDLGWSLIKDAEIDFETASENWTEEGICTVYFSEKGTLIFLNMDICSESYPIKDANTLTFALSETVMAFNLNYCENGIEKRSIIEVNDERMQDEGEILDVEATSEDTSELIWNQIEVVLGKRFWDIELEEKATRFIFKDSQNSSAEILKEDKIVKQNITEQKNVGTIVSNNRASASESKKWWEFWK